MDYSVLNGKHLAIAVPSHDGRIAIEAFAQINNTIEEF